MMNESPKHPKEKHWGPLARFSTKQILAFSVIALTIGCVGGYIKFQGMKIDLENYLKMELKMATKILYAYEALNVASFRDVPGMGAAFGARKSARMLDELIDEENSLYNRFGGNLLRSLMPSALLDCAQKVHLKRIQEFNDLNNIIANDRFINMRDYERAIDDVTNKMASECFIAFSNHFQPAPFDKEKPSQVGTQNAKPETVAPPPIAPAPVVFPPLVQNSPAPPPANPADAVATRDPSKLVESIVKLSKSGNFADIDFPKNELDNLPKPSRGDKKTARERNAKGIEALRQDDFNAAVERFAEGERADQADIEVVNNLGYAQMMLGNVAEAYKNLIRTLSLDSSRGGAWANLGQLYAKQGDEDSAAACFKLTYLFSKAPEKTIEFFKKLADSDLNEKVRSAAAKATESFPKMQPRITSVRYQYQKVLYALPLGPTGYSSPSSKIVELLSNPSSQDDWKFINELEADLGQCSTGSACARETEIGQAQDMRKAKGLTAQIR